ncbi:MAG: 50S ribosomal protein L22 [Patescibacteria group bacterium]
MEVKATLRHLHIAPRKMRLAAGVVKGMDVARAERELTHRAKRSAPVLLKLLRSAAAGARHNFHIEPQNLTVKDVRIDAGPVQKRYRARAFGRAASIRRRTSHVSLVLETAGGATVLPERVPHAGPAVREATVEDVQRGAGSARGVAPVGAAAEQRRPRQPGFVRRMFRRKAI